MIDLAFQRVSKKYRIRHESDETPAGGPAARALRRFRGRSEDFWAVRDVSFEVKRGEALGIIGHNGAGKSTVLKLLSSITAPTSGEIRILGRLSSLIEVGSGFHPELTGRENIYLNGSILGMRRNEISAKLDSIIEFSGVEQFIDAPVSAFRPVCTCDWGFQSPPTSKRIFSCSTRFSLSGMLPFRPSAFRGSRISGAMAQRLFSSLTTWAP